MLSPKICLFPLLVISTNVLGKPAELLDLNFDSITPAVDNQTVIKARATRNPPFQDYVS